MVDVGQLVGQRLRQFRIAVGDQHALAVQRFPRPHVAAEKRAQPQHGHDDYGGPQFHAQPEPDEAGVQDEVCAVAGGDRVGLKRGRRHRRKWWAQVEVGIMCGRLVCCALEFRHS